MCLTFDEIPPLMSEEESKDKEENLPTAHFNDPVRSKEPVPDCNEYLCIHETPRPATPPNQPPPALHQQPNPQQLNQGVPVTPPTQPDQVENAPRL